MWELKLPFQFLALVGPVLASSSIWEVTKLMGELLYFHVSEPFKLIEKKKTPQRPRIQVVTVFPLIYRGLVPGSFMDTEIQGCSHPLYEMA